MTEANEAYMALGGRSAFQSVLDGIRDSHGVFSIETAPMFDPLDYDPEMGRNPAMVQFEYRDGESMTRARDAVEAVLFQHGMFLTYECNGDGAHGILVSYRIEAI